MSEAAAPTPRRSGGGAWRAWLIAGAAASFVAFLATFAYQPEISAGQNLGAHALSRSPVGYAALVELLRADGVKVRMNTTDHPRPQDLDETLLVLTPPAGGDRELAALARGRRVLIVPPKWLTAPDPLQPRRLTKVAVLSDTQVKPLLNIAPLHAPDTPLVTSDTGDGPQTVDLAPRSGEPTGPLPAARIGPVESFRTVAGDGLKPILADARGRAVAAFAPASGAFVIADADLLNNQGVATLDRAVFAVRLIEGIADGREVVFDLTLPHVAGQRSGLKLAFSPPFLPATTGLLLLAALLGLTSRERFGPLRRAGRVYGFGKRALADSAASLLALAGREPRLAGRYLDLNRAAAAEAVGVPADAPRSRQDALLDQIGEDRGAGPWIPIAAEAGAVKSRAALMALARRAYAWRMEMTRGRG